MKVRRVKFDFSAALPLHYLDGNIFSTHLVNSFHVLFPEAERFFIRSLQKIAPKVSDESLLKDLKAFSGQEGTHAHQHMLFWKALKQQGFDIDSFALFYRKFCYNMVEEAVYKVYGEEYGAKVCLAVTASLEHYTSMLAELVFEYQALWKEMPPGVRELIFWHAAEEIEHKSVAFDILRHIDDSYLLRAQGMLIATPLLWSFTLAGMAMFVWQDPEKDYSKMPADLRDFIQTIGHPAVRKFAGQWLHFFDKDFHPSQIANDHYAEQYFASTTQMS